MFQKFAKIQVLAVAEISPSDGGPYLSFAKSASLGFGKNASYYQSNAGPLDVPAMLSKVAAEYDISSDPKDYIYEAIRAVTATVPNENADAFHKAELLRYDHKLGKAVYQTFILKPHHVNHRAENPKTARGVILDTHYNDLSPALEKCPKCGSKTADVQDRDAATGIECKKCGEVVKDEFVELLVAVDASKDPAFARGVQAGVLNAGSMGCTCERTRCNICANVAYTKNEFCAHIKAGNKKKLFKTASGKKASFEFCEGVVFSEYSRVDQPADPKALQREVFAVAEPTEKAASSQLQTESEMLMLSTRVNALEQKVAGKTAGESIPIKEYIEQQESTKTHPDKMSAEEVGMVPTEEGNLPPDHKAASAKEIPVAKNPSRMKFADIYDDVSVQITAAGNARIFTPKGTIFSVKPEKKLATKKEVLDFSKSILASIAEHGLVKTMIDRKAIHGPKTAQILEFHVEDFAGGREEGDKKPVTEESIQVGVEEVREKPEDTVIGEEHTDRADEVRDTKSLTDSVLTERTPDFEDEVHTAPDTVLTEEMTDGKKHHEPKKLKDTVLDNEIHNFKMPLHKAGEKEAKVAEKTDPKKAQMGAPMGAPPAGAAPAAGGAPMAAPTGEMGCEACSGSGKMGEMACTACSGTGKMTAAGPGPEMACTACMGKGCEACAGSGKKMAARMSKEAALESRLKRLYQGRYAKVTEDAEKKIADAHANVFDHFARCMKIAAKRQALNLEASPIKQAFGDALLQPMDLDTSSYYPGMDQHTAVSLIERAASAGFEDFVESLLTRAAELMNKGDDFLKSAEEDLNNLTPVAPPVTQTAEFHEEAAEDNEVVREATRGNMMLAPIPTERTAGVEPGDRRTALRAALGRTQVNRVSAALRLGQ